jgi:hypothetical protein
MDFVYSIVPVPLKIFPINVYLLDVEYIPKDICNPLQFFRIYYGNVTSSKVNLRFTLPKFVQIDLIVPAPLKKSPLTLIFSLRYFSLPVDHEKAGRSPKLGEYWL